jgi:Chromo (CHRromatin Organisation MOdifier) domain
MLKELGKSDEEWPDVLAQTEFVLNHTHRKGLAGHTPVEVHGGTKPSKAMDAIFSAAQQHVIKAPQTEEIQQNFERLIYSLQKIHKEVDSEKEKTRRTKHRRPTQPNVSLPNFHLGDYVLWSQADQKYKDKLQVRWKGPFRITKILSDYVYIIQHLITNETREVHCTRLRFYHDASLEITEEIQSHINTQGMIYHVNSIVGVRYNPSNKKWEVLVKWQGFQNIEDTWEPFVPILEDVPEKVIEYLQKYSEEDKQHYALLIHKHRTEIQKLAKQQATRVRTLLLELLKDQ